MARELTIRLQTDQGIPLYRQIYNYVRDEIRSGSLEAGERLPSTRALALGLRVARSTADLAYSQVRDEIRSGSLEAGERLPSTRALASGLRVARSTADLAYSQLLSEGYIRVKKNSGYFVNEIENLAELKIDSGDKINREKEKEKENGDTKERKDGPEIDFSLRHTEMSVFPYSTWKKIMREVMAGADPEIFSHTEPGGDLSLRTTIAHYLHFSRGVRCTPEQVIVGAGNDYLLMLLRHILGEDRRVAMEEVSYLRAAQIFHSFGYALCPVRMDRDGMLPGAVLSSGADLVYAMPAHQFPMGCVMPVARRAALLSWAMEEPDRYIIEDDYDSPPVSDGLCHACGAQGGPFKLGDGGAGPLYH